MTERNEERKSIILRLIGSIYGVGETNYDEEVLKNMDFADDILCILVDTLARNTEYKGYERSMIDISEKSKKILEGISEIIDSAIMED